MLRYINRGLLQDLPGLVGGKLKYFILLQFGVMRQCHEIALVQCTKIRLTRAGPLPRMKLLQCTTQHGFRRRWQDIAMNAAARAQRLLLLIEFG